MSDEPTESIDPLERLRQAANDLGTQVFNAPSEEEVARIRVEVFPVPVPGATPTAELTLCRMALSCRVLGESTRISPLTLWAFLKATALGPILDQQMQTDADRRDWNLVEARLIRAVFGD
jgi:hypothetical protein